MILRSLTLEPLDDGEGGLATKPKPAKPGLLDRAKAAMTGAGNNAKKLIPRDPVAGLAKALIPIRGALARWDEIEAAHKARRDTSAYDKHLEKARATFAESHSPDDRGKEILARLALNERQTEANEAQRSAYSGSRELEWIQTPAVRDNIQKALALKIEVAKLELQKIRASEQKHLGPNHDANESPLVKAQAGKLATWEQQLELLNTRMVLHDSVIEAQRFLAAAKLLLENDEITGKKFIHKDDGDLYELLSVDEVTDDGLVEFNHAYKLRSATGRSWSGSRSNLEKCFKKL